MVTYRSKIGLELIVPLCVIFGGVITAMIFDKVWISILFLMPVAAFVTHMLLTTYYVGKCWP